jgi:hypothetical protein
VLDSHFKSGFQKNDRAAVCAVRTLQNNLFQSCSTHEKTQRLHHQFQEVFLALVCEFLLQCLTLSDRCLVFLLQTLLSPTPKITSASQFRFSSAHQTISHLNFAIYDILLDFWRPSSITMVHEKLDETPPTF